MPRRHKPADIGPWTPDSWRCSRQWVFERLEAARVVYSPEGKEPPYLWCIWGQETASACTESGRATSELEAKEAADRALRELGYTLA